MGQRCRFLHAGVRSWLHTALVRGNHSSPLESPHSPPPPLLVRALAGIVCLLPAVDGGAAGYPRSKRTAIPLRARREARAVWLTAGWMARFAPHVECRHSAGVVCRAMRSWHTLNGGSLLVVGPYGSFMKDLGCEAPRARHGCACCWELAPPHIIVRPRVASLPSGCFPARIVRSHCTIDRRPRSAAAGRTLEHALSQ